jgi:AraC-like DNA-binding protein
MSLIFEERPPHAPFVETLTTGQTVRDGSMLRPAESHWHLVLVNHQGRSKAIVTGPQTTAGVASWQEGAEIIWIKLKPGTFMPHLPLKTLIDQETTLPEASSHSFWLQGSAWQVPDLEHVDVFLERLERQELLIRDPIVDAVLQNQEQPLGLAPRTLRQRFLQATGMSKNAFQQIERAQSAATLLQQGISISDTIQELGYFDQPHLTKLLRRWVGRTPAELVRLGLS